MVENAIKTKHYRFSDDELSLHTRVFSVIHHRLRQNAVRR